MSNLHPRTLLKTVMLAPLGLAKTLFLFFASKLRWYALLGIILGGLMVVVDLLFLNKAVVVTGVHTRYETTLLAGRDFNSIRPQFRYFDLQGNSQVNATGAVPSDYLLTTGETVRLLMDPDKPSRIEIEAEFSPFMPGIVYASLGLLVLFLPRWLKKRWMKWRRNRSFPRALKPQASSPASRKLDRSQTESPTINRRR